MAGKRNLQTFKPSAWDLVRVSKKQSYGRVNKHPYPAQTVYVMFHVEKLFAVKTLSFLCLTDTTTHECEMKLLPLFLETQLRWTFAYGKYVYFQSQCST